MPFDRMDVRGIDELCAKARRESHWRVEAETDMDHDGSVNSVELVLLLMDLLGS